MQAKYVAVLCLLSAVLAAGLTRQYASREVIQTKIVDHIVVKDKIVTVTKQITRPDGTSETDSTTTSDITKIDDRQTRILDTKASSAPNWFISAGLATGVGLQPVYSVQASRRLLGPMFVGVSAASDAKVGISIGFEF